MKRLLRLSLGVLLLGAPAFAQAPNASAKSEGKSATAPNKTLGAMGKVTAVSADSLTVKGKAGEWTFAVDASTKVTASGASHKSTAMKADKKPTLITEFVKVGDEVSVRYHDMGATKHAASVMVRGGAPVPAKK